jgi:hypothetical protein
MVGHLPFEGNNPAQVLRRVLDGTYPSPERERPTIGKTWSQILDKALGRTPGREVLGRERDAPGPPKRSSSASASPLRAPSSRPTATTPGPFTERQRQADVIALLSARARSTPASSGDAMTAAADYNRALAYAPHDPTLLRIVSSLARRRSAPAPA